MSVTLTTWRNRPAIEVLDSKGELWTYTFEVLCGPGWSVRLAKINPETDAPGQPYVVTAGVPWRCSCPDYYYRMKRTSGEPCKHTTHAQELRLVLASLTGVAT